jgi:hypothetical protein
VPAENQLLLDQQKLATGQLGASLSPGAIPKAALVDSGLGSPEATVQTFFWAMCSGNLERLAQCYTMRWPEEVLYSLWLSPFAGSG